jgi:hypothetical protein
MTRTGTAGLFKQLAAAALACYGGLVTTLLSRLLCVVLGQPM